MVVFPNCKLNLGLNIIRKRSDGYHDLETIFYPVAIKDALEVIRADEDKFSTSGLTVNGSEKDNLCIRALNLLRKDYPQIPNIHIHLHKAISMGAGLGGGSADGAFTLRMLNDKFQVGLSPEQLINYALQLGSDCPFFIYNKPCFATGRGEIIEPVELDLSSYQFVIINPGIHVSTGAAFTQLTPGPPAKSIKIIIKQPIETWKHELLNDFEKYVFQEHPELLNIKNDLYKAGAIYASMSGSGSTIFGIYQKEGITLSSFFESYKVYIL